MLVTMRGAASVDRLSGNAIKYSNDAMFFVPHDKLESNGAGCLARSPRIPTSAFRP